MNNKQCPEMNKWISVEVKYLDHDKIVLTRKKGDTYTSKSEELMDFFHDEDTVEPNEMIEKRTESYSENPPTVAEFADRLAARTQHEINRLRNELLKANLENARITSELNEKPDAIDLIRSALSIAKRRGETTNWEAFENRCITCLQLPPKPESKELSIDEELFRKFESLIPMAVTRVLMGCTRIAQQHTNAKLEELEKWVQENKTTFIDGYETVPVKILKEKITSKKNNHER